ncbi:hypothetical protein NST17_19560 [Caldifermentibacillus hisashii]|uniref:Uncharacterized protein n=1 Tax=Caldifermentibacillus hisashii TaxID=996558 RepID=A0ABU9K2I0_9BACI
MFKKLLIKRLSKDEKEAFNSLKQILYPITDNETYKLLKTARKLSKAGSNKGEK